MVINGKEIANKILTQLTTEVARLKEKGVTPTLAVILVGNDPASESYIRQKQKAAESIGVEIRVSRNEERVSKEEIQKEIDAFNADPTVHGIIVQRPLPLQLQDETLLNSIDPNKDVDGFVLESKFEVPVAMAIVKIFTSMYNFQFTRLHLPSARADGGQAIFININQNQNFQTWIQSKQIVIIGRGETAGKPIAQYFQKNGNAISIIHSKTPDEERNKLLKNADIIVSCVGKQKTIQHNNIKKGVILVSVGINRDDEGILHGDYDEKDIEETASFYTPTPGGVGPVNVSCLMENLVTAATHKIEIKD